MAKKKGTNFKQAQSVGLIPPEYDTSLIAAVERLTAAELKLLQKIKTGPIGKILAKGGNQFL